MTAITSSPPTIGSVNTRLIAATRCLLALFGLFFVFFYPLPTQSVSYSALTRGSMVIFGIWSIALAAMAFRRDPAAPSSNNPHLGNVLFCAYLATLAQGTNNAYFTILFFAFFTFAILAVFFSAGFQDGMMASGASSILLFMSDPWSITVANYELYQSQFHPIYLVAIGYMISYWGGEVAQQRRMKILQIISNPLGVHVDCDNAIRINLERIMNFYTASACILVMKYPTPTPSYQSYYTSNQQKRSVLPDAIQTRQINPDSNKSNPINDEASGILANLPRELSICFDQKAGWWKNIFSGSSPISKNPSVAEKCRAIANLLDTKCFLTAPYTLPDGTTCRIYLTPNKKTFSQSDLEFLAQLLASASRVAENIRLMDKLASESAKHERFRISLDIHDTMIQPYIGLKLGLDALYRQAGTDNQLSNNISELLNMTEATISDLRKYVSTLCKTKTQEGKSLVSSVQEQVDRFKRFYGIDVDVKFDSDLRLNPPLTSAVLQIIAEGLSNIMRHTKTRHAYISMGCENKNLRLEIGNEAGDNDGNVANFTPRSINARTRTLGGTSTVKRNLNGYTVVQIHIPLRCNPCNTL